MVLKPESRSGSMVVVNYLKRNSSFEDCDSKEEIPVHSSKKARELKASDVIVVRNKKRTRKSIVRFASETEVFEITRPTKEEKKDMHMSKQDQTSIILEVTETLRRLQCNQQSQPEGPFLHDERDRIIEEMGIERIVEQQNPDRIDRVKSAVSVVLQHQHRSKFFNAQENQSEIINEAWLEKHYRQFSKHAAELARSRGLRDQEMAPSLYPRRIVMAR